MIYPIMEFNILIFAYFCKPRPYKITDMNFAGIIKYTCNVFYFFNNKVLNEDLLQLA